MAAELWADNFVLLARDSKSFAELIEKLKGVSRPFKFEKHDFDLWVGGDDLDMYQQLEGGFGSMRAILPM